MSATAASSGGTPSPTVAERPCRYRCGCNGEIEHHRDEWWRATRDQRISERLAAEYGWPIGKARTVLNKVIRALGEEQ